MELRSALEAAKQAVQQKDEAVMRLEDRVRALEGRIHAMVEVGSHEETRQRDAGTERENEDGREDAGADSDENVNPTGRGTADGVDGKGEGLQSPPLGSPKSSKSSKSPNLAFLEANHPWLSPVLLRLERLSNESESEFKVTPNKRFSLPEEDTNGNVVRGGRIEVDLTLLEDGDEDSMDAGSCVYRMENFAVVNEHEEHVVHTADSGRYKTPEPMPCRFSPAPGLPSVREDDARSPRGERESRRGHGGALETPRTGTRSSLRRRNSVNYALPSLNAKLRQGDAHTFGAADFDLGNTPGRKRR